MPDRKEKAEKLFRLYEKPMYYIALAVLKDHHQAEDAVADSFCRLISVLDKLGEPESPRTRQYVIKTIRNTAISRYRKNLREAYTELEDGISDSPDSLEEIYSAEERDSLDSALELLSPSDGEIVRLRGEGVTYKEIASKMSITESAARKRFERARKSLCENLKERGK